MVHYLLSTKGVLIAAAGLALAMLLSSRIHAGFTSAAGRRVSITTRASAPAVASPTLSTVSESAVRERAKASLLGGLVSDAASMPLHWIYDPVKLGAALDQRAGAREAPEFHTPHACPFYKAPLGDLSPYGYELYAMSKFLAEAKAPMSIDGNACAKSLTASYNASTGYLNGSSKHVKAAVEEGKSYPETGHPEDAQANAFVKAPAVVAMLAGKPEFKASMEVAIRVQQNNDKSFAAGMAGALVLEKVVLGATVAEAVAWALSEESGITAETKEQLITALGMKEAGFTETVAKLGPACSLPSSLQNSVLGAAKFTSFVEGVRANMLAGGDNCSRSVLLGALLAAQEGSMAAIPADWKTKTNNWATYESLADQVIALRG